MLTEPVINSIFKNVSFSQKEMKIIGDSFHKVLVNKGDVVLNIGDTVDHLYFVESGCLRVFFRDESGKDHTLQFAINDWWLSDFTGFFSKSKSITTIECIKSSVLYKLSKDDLDNMYKKIPKLENFFRLKLESAYSSFQKRTLDNLSKTTKQRYLDFMLNYPDIVKCIKSYHIASYLGIAVETLSRLKKEIKNESK